MNTVTTLDFEQFARHLRGPLLRHLERLVGERAQAEDLLQETLLRVQGGLGAFAGRAAPDTWAHAIATNVARDYQRSRARRAPLVDLDEAQDLAAQGLPLDETVDGCEMESCVRGVIDALPPSYRDALVLHDLEGRSARETADSVACSVATAKIRIHRARQKLKAAIAGQCDLYHDSEDRLRCVRSAGGPR